MCLTLVDKVPEIIGYQVVCRTEEPGVYEARFAKGSVDSSKRFPRYKLGRWYVALQYRERAVLVTEKAPHTEYAVGFHVFLREEDAFRYMNVYYCTRPLAVVQVAVPVDRITCTGWQSVWDEYNARVLVCSKRKILREVE